MTAEAPKTAPAPAAAPKRQKPLDDDDDAGKKPAAVAKPGFLPTGLSRAIVVASVLLSSAVLVATLVPHRYVLVPVPRSDNALVYRIDGLTGQMSLCSATQCQPVAN